jgi:hypothetical protein
MAGFGVGALLFIWAVGALLGGGDTPSVRGAANVRPDGVPLTSAAPSSNPPASGRLAAPGNPSSSASASPSATAAPTTTVAPTTTTPVPATCPDSAIRVWVTAAKPSYQVGEQPLLTLHIANGSALPCFRDVSHQLRSIEILTIGGKSVLWSSTYCYSLHTNEIRTLKPQQVLSYSVTWAGRTAAPGCPADRTTVPAGSYELVGKLGKLTGQPTLLTLR